MKSKHPALANMTEINTNGKEKLMSVEEVCEYLSQKRDWVYKHAKGSRKPVLPSYKLGGTVRFRQSEVDEFVERLKRQEHGLPVN